MDRNIQHLGQYTDPQSTLEDRSGTLLPVDSTCHRVLQVEEVVGQGDSCMLDTGMVEYRAQDKIGLGEL